MIIFLRVVDRVCQTVGDLDRALRVRVSRARLMRLHLVEHLLLLHQVEVFLQIAHHNRLLEGIKSHHIHGHVDIATLFSELHDLLHHCLHVQLCQFLLFLVVVGIVVIFARFLRFDVVLIVVDDELLLPWVKSLLEWGLFKGISFHFKLFKFQIKIRTHYSRQGTSMLCSG